MPKKKTVPEKKISAKKAAPAKKGQPVKSDAQKKVTTAAKAVPAKKKSAVKAKPASAKKAAPAKASPKKQSVVKASAKKADPKKKSAKTSQPGKGSSSKNSKTKTQKVTPSGKVPSKGRGSSKPDTQKGNKVIEKPRTGGVEKNPVKNVPPGQIPDAPPSKGTRNNPNPEKTPVEKNDSVLLSLGGKLVNTVFFVEDDEQEDRAPKKKVSGADSVEKPTACMRHRASLAEETPEELYARVIQELQEENLRLTKECSNQLCTKCCRNPVAPEFRVDKDLGFCEECAELLGLGQSKEARHLTYQAKLLGLDSLDEARDDDFGEAPSQQEIEEADKDLDLDDDSDIG